ncbi:unnamed protein product [Mortierella alpina]
MALNKFSKNGRRIAPMSSVEHRFMTFSERELISILWKTDRLRDKIQQLAASDFHLTDSYQLAQADLLTWLGSKEPGFLIKRLFCNVAKEGLTVRQRGKAGHKAAVKLMTIDQIKQHLELIRRPDYDLQKATFFEDRSIPTGTACSLPRSKLKELQSVRFKRPSEMPLPCRLTTTTGGTDYYLTEIRNVVKRKGDVARLWPDCRPEAIKILGIDLGQACVVGASALLPGVVPPVSSIKSKDQFKSTAGAVATGSLSAHLQAPPWMEEQKGIVPSGATRSISNIESSLPPLRGQGASYTNFVEELQKVEQQLDDFYNGNNMRFKSHKWDATRASESEFKIITNRLLKLLGGSIGAQRKEDMKVVIAIGLGQFSSSARLSSMHGSFMSFFVQKASQKECFTVV